MVKDPRQGWALIAVVLIILVTCMAFFYAAESNGNPLVGNLNLTGPYMEGKEARFGLGQSALFASATTGTSTGAVNNMHDSLTPLGGMVPLFLILTSEVLPGGVGSGLYTMLAYVIIGVFIAGLMIGRTPEYLGKKIEALEMRGSIVVVLASGLLVLIFSGIALVHFGRDLGHRQPWPARADGDRLRVRLHVQQQRQRLRRPQRQHRCSTTSPAHSACSSAGSPRRSRCWPWPAPWRPRSTTRSLRRPCPPISRHSSSGSVFVILLVGVISFFSVLAVGPLVEHLIMTQGGTF